MFVRTTAVAVAAAAALTVAAGASGAARSVDDARQASVRSQAIKTPTPPTLPSTTTVMAITAFPTGGRGSGTEATCELWADQLAADEAALDEATDKQDIVDASNALNEDVDHALDAGCAVIYSARTGSGHVRTTQLAAAVRGGFVKTNWSPSPSVVYVSAFPTGGKGSGTEATCALWTKALQEDQAIIDNAPETDKDDASWLLERDIENALDAGCAVIY